MDKKHIINITTITFDCDFLARKMIKIIQIYITEKLAGQIHSHKIPCNIQFQNPTVFLVIFRARTDKMSRAPDSFRCPFAEPAAIAVFDEMLFKDRIDIIENQMMDDAIPEISGKNFPLDRLVNDKTDTSANLIFPADNILIQPEQFFFITIFKSQDIGSAPFVFARVKIGAEQIKKQLPVLRLP